MIDNIEKEKYWQLFNESKINASHTDDLLRLFSDVTNVKDKCTIAIFMSGIKDDSRVVEPVLECSDLWKDSEYNGWAMTSTARVFLNYPAFRSKYGQLMMTGNPEQRRVLASALFFLTNAGSNITENDALAGRVLLSEFMNNEKDISIVEHLKKLKQHTTNITKKEK